MGTDGLPGGDEPRPRPELRGLRHNLPDENQESSTRTRPRGLRRGHRRAYPRARRRPKIPPKLAPTEVIVPIWRATAGRGAARGREAYIELKEAGFRVWRSTDEEQFLATSSTSTSCAGVLVRIEIGPKDIENGQAVLARRTWPARREGARPRAAHRPGNCSGEIQRACSPATEFRDEEHPPGRELRGIQGDHRGGSEVSRRLPGTGPGDRVRR